MKNADIGAELKRIFEMPYEQLRVEHPIVSNLKPEFVEYTPEGRLSLKYPVRPDHRNGYGALQGGILTSFIDNNFGMHMHVVTEASSMPTVNITVNLHKGISLEEDKVIVTSWVVSAGKRVVSLAAEAKTENGKILATAQSNMLNADGARIDV